MAATELLELGATSHPVEPQRDGLIPATRPHGYLEMFNLFRVIACVAVLAQHSFIWTNMTGNFVGTGFITTKQWVETIYRGLSQAPPQGKAQKK